MTMITKLPPRVWMTGAIAMALAISFGGPCCAEGVLDQQLGPAPADAKKDAPAPNAESDKQTPPASADPADPSAAKTLDDADLVKKLTNSGPDAKSAGQDPAAVLQQMLDRMGQSQARLADKDVSVLTQETQRRIITDLDVAIEYARKKQQQSQSKPTTRPSDEKPGPRQISQGQKQGQSGSTAAKNSQLPTGPIETAQSNGESLRQKGPSEWGNLPPKDRDLISNGVNEQYLPAYKEMIDRYYQALAEMGKSKDK